MERRQCHRKNRPPPTLAPPRRVRGERREGGAGGSFSASLLDAIYRSLDEGGDGDGDGDGAGVTDVTLLRPEEEMKTAVPPQFWWAKSKQAAGAGRSRRESAAAVARPRHSGYASSTTSSSDASSSYSFTCSSASTTDTESTTHRRRHSQPPPRQPEDVDDAAAAPPNSKAKKKKSRPCFPGARLRPRGTTPPPPPSSGLSPATFACVVKALFTSSRPPRKPKTPTAVPLPQASPPVPQPPCMSATTSNTKASERRSVRFCPDAETSLVRGLADVEEDEDGSDASTDLFELESLRGADGDELPVYGTTSLATNRVIAQRRGQLVTSS
uniref:Uncharacterized protein n=1 Tax=Oryza coarctata TaxID=77588 RepID=A0A8K1DFZ5_ORYCO|nr:hypothetical protein [Oryza coarctata]